jgi:hypothetical protein
MRRQISICRTQARILRIELYRRRPEARACASSFETGSDQSFLERCTLMLLVNTTALNIGRPGTRRGQAYY